MTQERGMGRKAVLERLKKYSGRKRLEIDASAAGRSVSRETDRGAVILMGAQVEDALQEKIEQQFRPLNSDEHDGLFGPDRAVGSFSAKIRLAYALGIIDRDTARLCHVLREMRNACAHCRGELSFGDKVLRDPLYILFRDIAEDPADPSHLDPKKCRSNMMVAIHYLLRLIDEGDRDVAAEQTNSLVRRLSEEALTQRGTSSDEPDA